MKVAYGLAAAAACLAVVFGINHYNEYVTPYSNIRLSINPDVEMTLNHHGQVLSVEGLNEDGELLVEGYNPKKQDKIIVADELIDRAIEMGFLSDDAVIIFDIDAPDKELLTQYGIELRSEAEIHTAEFANVNIIIIERNEDASDDYEYNDDDYEPIVIPIPEQTKIETTVPKTKPSVVNPVPSDSGYEETDDGDSRYHSDDGVSDYRETATTTVALETIPTISTTTAAASPSDDSGYDDSNYGESNYDESNYGGSGYDTDD